MPDSVPLVRKTVSCHYKILLIKPSEEIESSLVFVTEWVCNSQCKWRTLLCFVFNYCIRTWRSLAFLFLFWSCTRVRLHISWTSTSIQVKWANWIGLVSSRPLSLYIVYSCETTHFMNQHFYMS